MKEIFGLTHLEYPEKDGYVGMIIASFSLLPYFSFTGLIGAFIASRSIKVAWVMVGLVISTALNETLKKLIKHERPQMSYKKGYGMPSDHSQFMSFFTAWLLMLVSNGLYHRQFVWFITMCTTIATACVMVSRVYLGVHSVAQVLAGSTLGFVLGKLWYDFSQKSACIKLTSRISLVVELFWTRWCYSGRGKKLQ